MFELNLLTGKTGSEAKEPLEIDEQGFWIQFFNLLIAKGNYSMRPKHVAFMAWIMSREDPDKCWFSSPNVAEVIEGFKIHRTEISYFKPFLTDIGLIVNVENPVPGNKTRPHKTLLQIKKLIQNQAVSFTFTMELKVKKDGKKASTADSRAGAVSN